jgi:hypothetical protein
VARNFNLVRYTKLSRGGHFAFWEQPELMVGDVREFIPTALQCGRRTPRHRRNPRTVASLAYGCLPIHFRLRLRPMAASCSMSVGNNECRLCMRFRRSRSLSGSAFGSPKNSCDRCNSGCHCGRQLAAFFVPISRLITSLPSRGSGYLINSGRFHSRVLARWRSLFFGRALRGGARRLICARRCARATAKAVLPCYVR